ncbi:F0F1 ATP synthase subunit delta [Buchnera aphidicola]|uniref:ATP synthase subunit delta n=1 Tax=Buchnera aphidicola (Artemisaphis artemisicola) TaxID=1241836 RepID=A0A4D6XH45_9GAMM|nr:F0F1 ATP synthase subunit delta [Buchnera aphidicola]QCI15712.1 F0F1 ATP synthase subunit delta [Buchnera aphidicola (Artemisaphis artemisicola)]
MSLEDTIARPYAKAIFETAVENNSIEEWKDLLIFISKISSYKKMKNFLSGSLSSKYLSKVFIEVSKDMVTKNSINFIKLLAENQRFKISKNILKKFLQLEACYKNIIVVELKSGSPLKDWQFKYIKEKLEQFFSRKIKFVCKRDADIIDGIIVKINDTVFDLSVQNYLKQLSSVLKF